MKDELVAVGVAVEWMDCDPALADTAAFCAHLDIAMGGSINAIVIWQVQRATRA